MPLALKELFEATNGTSLSSHFLWACHALHAELGIRYQALSSPLWNQLRNKQKHEIKKKHINHVIYI